MNRKRQDEASFISRIQSGRDFPYLINPRPPGVLREFAEGVLNDPRAVSITVTFKEELRVLFEERILRDIVHDGLTFFSEIEQFILYPDIDISGNFHYHGVIIMQKKIKPKLKRYFTKHIGFIKIAYITDQKGWYKYMRKADDLIYADNDIVQLVVMKQTTIYLSKLIS